MATEVVEDVIQIAVGGGGGGGGINVVVLLHKKIALKLNYPKKRVRIEKINWMKEIYCEINNNCIKVFGSNYFNLLILI